MELSSHIPAHVRIAGHACIIHYKGQPTVYIYTDAETVVKLSKDQETNPIHVNTEVKQGCPISLILFNLTTELLIRVVQSRCNENSDIAFKLYGNPIYVLAYADDLVLESSTCDGLQNLLDDVSEAANILNLSF